MTGRLVAGFLALCWLPMAWAAAAGAATPRVIVVGVDGLSVDGVARGNMPRLHQLMARAAWTLEARGVMPTLSSPNWASAINGAGPEQHGITSNGYLRKMVELRPVCAGADGVFPTIFRVLRTQRPSSRIAVFHDWPGFADLLEKRVPDVLRHEHGASRTADAAVAYWKESRPELMFVHLDNVDHAGHEYGWSSPEYFRAVEDADGYLGRVLDMLAEQGALDSTFVLVTSDHGGKGRNHGKNSLAEIQIPWILAGPDVAPGRMAASIYTYDTAATIAWIFQLDTPECWIGRPATAAFRPALLLSRNSGHDTQAGGCGTTWAAPAEMPVEDHIHAPQGNGKPGNEPKH
jgi:type I phosphodiesterase/nucleotide pyrophosphatase